jgi:hypothetical protein
MSHHTVTGLISTSGRLFEDWSADYRFFSHDRFDPIGLFDVVRAAVLERLPPGAPVLVAMDDTISRKRGHRIPGVAWRRDPMSPLFRPNMVLGRRFIQVSAVVSPSSIGAPGRAVPIDFIHAPTERRPAAAASADEWSSYRARARAASLSKQGADRLGVLRTKLDTDGHCNRPLWVTVDGSYTNRTVLSHLPSHTVLIGRIRRDASLHPLPVPKSPHVKGRTRQYGKEVITPDAIRQDPSIPWQTTPIYAAGKLHDMRYKSVAPLLWRPAGAQRPLRVVVVAPLAYRLSKNSRVMFRKPAFLICSDPDLPPEKILAAYVSRWDIEVNIRDEKQLLGFDQAQVRNPASACNAPQLAVAAYALLLVAAIRAFGVNGLPPALPQPKWRASKPRPRASTNDLINHLRFNLWGRAIADSNFSGFVKPPPQTPTATNLTPSLPSALFYSS